MRRSVDLGGAHPRRLGLSYYLHLVLAPALLALLGWIGHFAWQRRGQVPGARSITAVAAACSWWLALSLAEMVTPTPELSVWARHLAYAGIAWVPVAWLAFALSFTGRASWLRSAPFRLAAAAAAATGVVAVTMPWHSLMWGAADPFSVGPFRDHVILDRGWWFWGMAGVAWVLSTIGSVLILITFAQSQRTYRRLSAWLAVGATLPVVVNVAYVTGLVSFGKDPSPLTFGAGAVAVAVGVLRYRFLDLHPIARTALVESQSDGVVSVDASGRVTDFNQALARVMGPALQVGAPLASAAPALAGALDRPEGEAAVVRGGRACHLEWRAVDLDESGGRGRLVVLRDVTERHIAEEALGAALAELRVRNEDLDAFAHTVAHDLKNPIHTIRGYAETMRDAAALTPEVQAEGADVIVKTADKMDAIVRELLLFASVRQRDVPRQRVDLGVVVAGARERLRSVLDRYDATLDAPEAWPLAVGYGPWIEEVWANFVSNAAKYGGPSPHIETGADVEDDRVRLWVQDRGPGLSADDCPRVFSPFTRLGDGQVEGHGLGLAIVARIAEKLDGEAGVESEPGHGCRFYLTLPAFLDGAHAVRAEALAD